MSYSVQDTWHCSICRRKLLSRVKKEATPGSQKLASAGEGLTIAPDAGMPTPPLVTPAAALSPLVAGLASMASSLTATPPAQVLSQPTPAPILAPLTSTPQISTTAPVITTVTPAAPLATTTTPLVTNTTVTPTKPILKEEALPNGVPPRKERRPSRAPQRSSSKEEIKDWRTNTVRRAKDPIHRDKAQVSRRRSDDEDFTLHNKAGIAAPRRGHRVSDYISREPSEDHGPGRPSIKMKHAPHEDEAISAQSNQRQPQEIQPQQTAGENKSGIGGIQSPAEESAPAVGEGGRGILTRRKSIVRQKTYDEEIEDNTLLTLWSTGQLPVRRHSAQDPSRKTEHSEFQRSKESLDVPQGPVHRHHSWDYNFCRGNNQGRDSLLPR